MSHPDELIFLREQVRLLPDRVSLVEAFARQSERTRRDWKPRSITTAVVMHIAQYPGKVESCPRTTCIRRSVPRAPVSNSSVQLMPKYTCMDILISRLI